MARLVQRIGLRVTHTLRARLDQAAEQGGRSVTAEVTRRLNASFSHDGQQSLDVGELPLADEYDQAARVFAGAYDVAKRMGADDAQARHFASEKTRRVTGIDWARELGSVQQGGAHVGP